MWLPRGIAAYRSSTASIKFMKSRLRLSATRAFSEVPRSTSRDNEATSAVVGVATEKKPEIVVQSRPPPNSSMLYPAAAVSAALLSVTAATVLVLREDETKAKLQQQIHDSLNRLEGIKDKISERSKSMYHRCIDTGVAATVLFKFLKSMLSSANEEAKVGLKMRVAALLADLSGANESRRRAIVNAGGGAVVDWLLETLSSSNSTPPITQAEAARALSYLISDAATCESVLARPQAISHLFRFIYSLRPHSAKQQKRIKALHDSGEVLKGKSMLVAAIMDIIMSSCDNPNMKVFRPRLPPCADLRDIAEALQVIEEGGLELDESHDSDDDDDSGKGMRGIGIRVLGDTAVIGLLGLKDIFGPDFLIPEHSNILMLPHLHAAQSYFSNNNLQYYSAIRNLSVKGGNAYVSDTMNAKRQVASNENFEYPGLWDDLQSRHVAVPLAAWALASWASASSSNRSKIAELDRDGHAVMTAIMAPERTVKWHGALITQLLLEDKSLPVIDSVAEWSSSLLGMAVQACKSQDIPLAYVALCAFFVSIERSTNAQKVIMEKGLHLMREIAKQTQKDQGIQEVLAKALEVLSTRGTCLSLDESKRWSGILLRWIFGRLSAEGTKSSGTKVIACILEDHGPGTITISQAWLTLLLTDLIGLSKAASTKGIGASSKSKEVKGGSTVQSQIIQLAGQAATQLASLVAHRAESQEGSSSDSSETLPMDDLLSLYPFSEQIKAKKKDRLAKVDAAEYAFATLKGIKALTELCSENHAYQKRIIECGGLCLLRHFMISDDYEQLAATEAYDASRLPERQDQVSSSADKNANLKANSSSSVRVPSTAHIRKHASRLLNILSLHLEASEVIAQDKVWCKWLEDCVDGQISGCSDLKIRSYARATLLNIPNTKSNGNSTAYGDGQRTGMDIQGKMCPRYEDMIFLVNPESSHFNCQTYDKINISQSRTSGMMDNKNLDYMRVSPHSTENVHQDIDSSKEDLKPSISNGTFQDPQQESGPFLDVVFVHGLCGGPFKTWRVTDDKCSSTSKSGLVEKIDRESGREGTCWPREWLAVDLPQTRLLTVKYKTNLSQWSGATLPLEEVSSMLLNKLVAAGVGDRPVVFVTHSMGGLVVKQMLFQAGKQKLTKLVNNTCGVVFYSCPHFGSKLADVPWRMGLVLRPAPSIGELRSGSPRLEELNHFVRQLHKKGGLQVLSFSETKVTPLVEGYGGWALRMEVVPIESAYPGFGELVVLDGTDHINSCKPVSRTDPAYNEVLHFLQTLQRKL